MKRIKLICKLLVLITFINTVSAQPRRAPASPYPVTVKQSDSTQLTIFAKGDENRHWKETLDGYTVIENAKGILEYAKLNKKGELVCSCIKANEIEKRTKKEKTKLLQVI